MMTTFAAIFGALPIALGTGAGAELRQPLGIAVVGGLCVSQLLTLYITPVVYIYLDRIDRMLKRRLEPQLRRGAGAQSGRPRWRRSDRLQPRRRSDMGKARISRSLSSGRASRRPVGHPGYAEKLLDREARPAAAGGRGLRIVDA